MNQAALTAYRRLLATITKRTTTSMTVAWDGLGAYNKSDITRFTRLVTPILEGAKTTTVSASTSFYSTTLKVPAVAVDPKKVAVTPNLRDPFTSIWHALSEGRPWTEARGVGRSTLEAVGEDYITSTARRTGDAMTLDLDDKRIRWTRIASPGACDWCQERDGDDYPTAEAGDYGHARCNCIVVPLVG